VQFKTRQLLWSLHVDIGEQNDCIEWKRCRRGDNEEKPLLLPAIPGLEMSVASECASIDDSSDTESIVETPRAVHIPSPAYTSLPILPSTPVKACRTTQRHGVQEQTSRECGAVSKGDEHTTADSSQPSACDNKSDGPHVSPSSMSAEQGAWLHQCSTASSCPSLDLDRKMSISLEGDAIGKSRRYGAIEQLVAAASQSMIGRGFELPQQGIQIDRHVCSTGGERVELTFPCEVTARGFYLTFNDYHWETSNYQCMVVKLSNEAFYREMDTPDVKRQFLDTASVTPTKISDYFALHPPRLAS